VFSRFDGLTSNHRRGGSRSSTASCPPLPVTDHPTVGPGERFVPELNERTYRRPRPVRIATAARFIPVLHPRVGSAFFYSLVFVPEYARFRSFPTYFYNNFPVFVSFLCPARNRLARRMFSPHTHTPALITRPDRIARFGFFLFFRSDSIILHRPTSVS